MNSRIWQRPLATVVICLLAGCGGGGGYGGGNGNGAGTTYVIGGTVTGLKGTVVLRDNGQNDLAVAANGAFAFTNRLAGGRPYIVTVQQQPSNPAQQCDVADGSGTVGTTDISNVAVTCTDLVTTQLQAESGVHSATLTWTEPAGATSFNVFLSSARNCDIANFASCPDGASIMNVTSPLTVDNLRNGQAYFFRIETVSANGAHVLSNEAGARPNVIAFDEDVLATVAAADGTVYLGGDFSRAGVTSGTAVPLDAATGRVAAVDFPIVHGGQVFAIAADGAGGWYLGGDFAVIGGVTRNHLAHVLADGSVDPNFDPSVSHPVFALAVNGGTVYAGGLFGTIGPPNHRVARECLAAFSSAGEVLSWNPALSCNSVNTLAVGGDGTIYAGGFFDTGNGTGRKSLAAIGADGTILDGWQVGLDDGSGHGGADSLLVVGNKVYVAGEFTVVNSAAGPVARTNLAAIGTDGVVDPDFQPEADGGVFALARAGESLYVAGNFHSIGAGASRAPRAGLAALSAAGQLLPWQADPDGFVESLAASGDVIYVGGNFNRIGTTERRNIAAISANGAVLPWHVAPSDSVNALTVANGVVYVGGQFGAIDSVARSRLAALDASGALLPWAPAADDDVEALAFANDVVYVGGSFTHVDQAPRNHLAAIDSAGHLTQWDPDVDDRVLALTIANDTIYAGGLFSSVGGLVRHELAAIKSSGEILDWSPNVSGTVLALASTDSTVYVGGAFDATAGTQRFNLIAVGASGIGVIDPAFRPDPDAQVSALAIADNVLYAGGIFTQMGNLPRRGLAALDPTGAVLPNFQFDGVGGPSGAHVLALKAQAGRIYFGGIFSTVGSTARSNLAAVSTTGRLLDWNPGNDDRVLALEQTGSTIYVAGRFTTLSGAPRYSFGAVSADGTGEPLP